MSKTEQIHHYLVRRGWIDEPGSIEFLAAGEYNENYLVHAADGDYVFRINHGSQLGLEEQIAYEFKVLQAVEPSGVTPKAFFVDPDPDDLGGGILLMEYLEGRPLDYPVDLPNAAVVFALIHQLPVPAGLIVQANPVEAIAAESYGLINRYEDHPLVGKKTHLLRYHEKILSLEENTKGLFSNEPLCIVNTEVNSRNFIVQSGRTCLVDWEKAVVSYRYQDLGHFLVPTTTLWKSDYVYSDEEKLQFLKGYRQSLGLGLDLKELFAKTKILERTIVLRAISWCFMAYYEYTRAERSLCSEETLAKIQGYLNDIECFTAW